MKIKLPVTWEICGEIEVEADSLKEAIDNFDPHDHDLPSNGDYVDGSFRLTDTDPNNIVEMTGQDIDEEQRRDEKRGLYGDKIDDSN